MRRRLSTSDENNEAIVTTTEKAVSGKIYIAGHRGMVGSALCRFLDARNSTDDARPAMRDVLLRDRAELDLSCQRSVESFFRAENIDQVYLAAARVGGIASNQSYPADYITENVQIQTNIIQSAWRSGVRRLLFLGSSCIYPRLAPQPITENALLTGALEPTNEAYAVAKIAGIKMCEAFRRQHGSDFRSVMPTNLYGPHDNFDLENSHVLPALLRIFIEAVKRGQGAVSVWGSGKPRREFLYVDDLASACVHIMEMEEEQFWSNVDDHCSHLNVGCGEDVSIAELAALIASIVGFDGDIVFDDSRPDGTPRKLLEVSRLQGLGWQASTSLQDGIRKTAQWLEQNWTQVVGEVHQ